MAMIVEVVGPFLVQRISEGELYGVIASGGDAVQVFPHRGEPEGSVLLTKLEGEDHIIGGQRFAIAPGDAFAEGQIEGIGIRPGSAFSQPGGQLAGQRVKGEQGFIEKANRAGGIGMRPGEKGFQVEGGPQAAPLT